MKEKIEVLTGPRARVVRQKMSANGEVIKSVIPIATRLPPVERRRVALQIEWERWLRLRLR